MNSHELNIHLEVAKRHAMNMKRPVTWLGLFGKATVRFVTEKPAKILYTLKYENSEIKVFDAEGAEISQELPHVAAEKISRPVKQSGSK